MSVVAEGPWATRGFTGRIVGFRRVFAHRCNPVMFVELLRELHCHIHILTNLHDALPNVPAPHTHRVL